MKKKWIIGGIVGVVLLGGAFGVSAMTGDSSFSEKDVSISQKEAEKIATEEVGELTIQEVDKDFEDNVEVYEIEGKEAEVEVDANTGEVLKVEREGEDDEMKPENVEVSKEQAEKIAKEQVNAELVKVELEGEGYYEIEMKDGQKEYDLKIDATTGEVLEKKEDKDDD
ncbi:PepSY domain-containing protein [Halobacillus salinus]|uniref:PepSY domain-containing protein n=1 Tax=Halobacillus salinus TaxID=192814 RepID=UPI00159124FD|nr:PepSY domain-containing protein [Halobacillus salinus]